MEWGLENRLARTIKPDGHAFTWPWTMATSRDRRTAWKNPA